MKQFESSQAVLAETAVNAFIQDLPESVKDLTDAQEAVTEEARLLGMSEENAMVSDFLREVHMIQTHFASIELTHLAF